MGIRDSLQGARHPPRPLRRGEGPRAREGVRSRAPCPLHQGCLLYTSDAADERSSVDLGGRRIIEKKTKKNKKKKQPTHTSE